MNINALNLLRSYMFSVGSRHRAVNSLKIFLNSNPAVKIFDLKTDAIFDARTQTALAQFQKSKGLIATGRMDLRTWAAVGQAIHPAQINVISTNDSTLRQLLTFGDKLKQPLKTSLPNASFVKAAIQA